MRSSARAVAGALITCTFVLVASACGAGGGGGGGMNSPDELGEALADAIAAKDTAAVRALACEDKRGEAESELPEGLADLEFRAEFVDVTDRTGDTATINIKLRAADLPADLAGELPPIPFTALHEDGGWVLC